MAGRQWSAREAYYEAVMELGMARDLLQVRIGEYFAEVKRVRQELKGRSVPKRIRERFDELESITTRHLIDDLVGDEPNA